MKEFIEDFAKGNIQIKYFLVDAKFSRRKRRWLTLFTALISIVLIGLSAKYYDHIGANTKWPLVLLTILFLLIPSYIVGKRILQVEKSGKILFFAEYLEIHQNNEVRTLKYSEILKIEYCGELPEDLLQTNTPSYSTYRVKFYQGIKDHFILHINKDIFLTKEEKQHFRKIHPILPSTLKAIQPKYGTLEDTHL